MKKPKLSPGDLPPLTPDLFSTPAPTAGELALRAILASERKRHGRTEALLVRYIDSLESQNADLRTLAFASLATLKPTEAK